MKQGNRVLINHSALEWKTVVDKNQPYALADGLTYKATGTFGVWYSSRCTGDGFTMVLDSFVAEQSLLCSMPADNAFLMIVPLQGCPTFSYNNTAQLRLSPQQFEILYTAGKPLEVAIEPGNKYQILSIACGTSLLRPYLPYCGPLLAFIDKTMQAPEQTARIFSNPQFLSTDCNLVMQKIVAYKKLRASLSDQKDGLALLYYYALLCELLTLLGIRLQLLTGQRSFPATDMEAARAAKQIILADLERFPTLDELATKLNTSKYRLQQAFKYLYGQTIGKYSTEIRLEKGYTLLQTTTYPLRVICEMIGYPDPGNFSLAFRNRYGCRPGVVQKEAARQIQDAEKYNGND